MMEREIQKVKQTVEACTVLYCPIKITKILKNTSESSVYLVNQIRTIKQIRSHKTNGHPSDKEVVI